jgi:hypothetical protein
LSVLSLFLPAVGRIITNDMVRIKRTVANFFITSPLDGYEVEVIKNPPNGRGPLLKNCDVVDVKFRYAQLLRVKKP